MSVRIAMLLDHDGFRDSRVARQAKTLQTSGFEIRVFCLNPNANAQDIIYNGIQYVQCFLDPENTVPVLSKLARRLRSAPAKPPAASPATNPHANLSSVSRPVKKVPLIKRALGSHFAFSNAYKAVAKSVEAFDPDIIHAHDLNMLPAGARLSKSLDCKLIYDSHEYEKSRNTDISRLELAIRMFHERAAVSISDQIITVSDSIADALVDNYDIQRPHVILNTPEHFEPVENPQSPTRNALNLPTSKPIGIYIGSLRSGRGIEQALKSLIYVRDLHLALMGDATPDRVMEIEELAKTHGVSDRFHFLPTVDDSSISQVLKLCDFSWIPIQKTCQSYDFALPNKLFQSFEANIPIFSTPLFEISQFVEHFQCGMIAQGFDAQSLAKSLKIFLETIKSEESSRENVADYANYTFKAMEVRLLNVYRNLSKSAPAGSSPPPLPHLKNRNEPASA